MSSNIFDFRLFRFSEPETATQQWRGMGKSGILVIFDQIELPEEDQSFLENVLKAVKLSPVQEHVFLLGCPIGTHWPLSLICREHAIHTVFLFGTPAEQVGIRAQVPLYSFTRLGDLSLPRADALKDIRKEREQNKNEKAENYPWTNIKLC